MLHTVLRMTTIYSKLLITVWKLYHFGCGSGENSLIDSFSSVYLWVYISLRLSCKSTSNICFILPYLIRRSICSYNGIHYITSVILGYVYFCYDVSLCLVFLSIFCLSICISMSVFCHICEVFVLLVLIYIDQKRRISVVILSSLLLLLFCWHVQTYRKRCLWNGSTFIIAHLLKIFFHHHWVKP